MKLIVTVFLLIIFNSGYSQQSYSVIDLKNGKFKDDSSYIYTLPFEVKKKVFLIQGYESMFSHKGEKALDFKVKNGTKVYAARNGIVTATREDSDKRGLKPENLSDGNYILIQHEDGSVANYWHFQKESVLVNVGDTVQTGQLIGLSGNTGYSAFPHLHFEVRGNDVTGNIVQLPTRFYTKDGIQYLRAGYFYKRRF
ncbi:MAG: M23 family metallopeptidase [Chitinophagaceae bacterium]|nr:M23 family metallopeptidase [Chitinophagaceae bacterium]MBK8606526.1 M23 family metallopeptidase [Chitinophagaceae bacterium]MBP6476176.1 M23 family metallopeptidase [Chitinophagaceae bacterium]MBP7107191.1 M23 family metallopeptidase [Chitinophagaceae bacterium]MBP7313607.1 M23 family metallopeptidase [Chitinophagaceae bacterium]